MMTYIKVHEDVYTGTYISTELNAAFAAQKAYLSDDVVSLANV